VAQEFLSRLSQPPGVTTSRQHSYCNRTATGLVQVRTRWTRQPQESAGMPISKPDSRTHWDGVDQQGKTQNPVVRKHRVGSSPTSGTRKIPAKVDKTLLHKAEPPTIEPGFGSSRQRKGLFHSRRLVTHGRQHVGVSIEGYGYGCMSKHFGNNLRVHVAGENGPCVLYQRDLDHELKRQYSDTAVIRNRPGLVTEPRADCLYQSESGHNQ
jgi:hypothetical protein